jgi:proteasome component ECM29
VEAKKVWPALVSAIGGKSWEGKEVVLKAFVVFVTKTKGFWGKDAKVADEVNKVRTICPWTQAGFLLLHMVDS